MALKENVLIGRLIPAGTGMDCYRQVEVARTNPLDSPIIDLDFDEIDNIDKAEDAEDAVNAPDEDLELYDEDMDNADDIEDTDDADAENHDGEYDDSDIIE